MRSMFSIYEKTSMIKLVDFLKEGSEQIYTIEIIAKNGKKTTSKVPASSPVELNGIVSALKKSKNAASVKVLKVEGSISENEDGPGSSKLSHMSLGMKTTRVVISGPDVVTNQEKILKLGQEMDPNFDAKFFPATGKIVGSMSQVKVQPLNLKLRDRKWKAEAEAKAQAQSLKKEGESSNSVKLVTDPQIIDKLLSNRRISNNCTYVIQGEYDNIVCFAYKGDEDERLDALTEYIKQHPSENEYEFVEYVNGEERTFTM